MLSISFCGLILLYVIYRIFKPQMHEVKKTVDKAVGGVSTVVGSVADIASNEFADMALENRLENQERLEELKKKFNCSDSSAKTITELLQELEK